MVTEPAMGPWVLLPSTEVFTSLLDLAAYTTIACALPIALSFFQTPPQAPPQHHVKGVSATDEGSCAGQVSSFAPRFISTTSPLTNLEVQNLQRRKGFLLRCTAVRRIWTHGQQ